MVKHDYNGIPTKLRRFSVSCNRAMVDEMVDAMVEE